MLPRLPHISRIFALLALLTTAFAADRPNIIWLVGEDLGPELGCYGDSYARTPNLDALAAEGARFTRTFTHAPVCAPSRSGLITGRYPTAIGTHHMRSKLLNPPPAFTTHLRKAGYHVAWPGKTDFNFDLPKDFFDSTNNWLNNARNHPRKPFFAYLNFGQSHESQIRASKEKFDELTSILPAEHRHDPAKAILPPYYPDTPIIRRDWANYHDLVSVVDYRIGETLKKIEEAGLTENTIIIFFGDHGRGLPRGKRWVYDSGIRVPLIIKWPGKIKPGTVREDLVTFVDLPATVLALAGIEVPKDFDGQPILQPDGSPAAPRKYIYAARDRMDETPDRIRAVRDSRYKYIRNFQPELPYAQKIAYMEEMPTMQEWRRLHAEGKLTGPQKLFYSPNKPTEELYDTEADPHEINNLATSPEHTAKLNELRSALDDWLKKTGDLGAIPEPDLVKRGLIADSLSQYEQRKQPGFRAK
ncbi:MAG TPA: sulfatase [Verrucomicrobiae bacterium]